MSIAPLDPYGVHFEDLPEQAWPRQEIIDGGLHVTPYAGMHHQVVAGNVFVALRAIAPRDYKVIENQNVLRRTSTDRLLIPDVVVLHRDACVGYPPHVPPEAVYLAVEVISPSSRSMDLVLKRDLYAEWGIGNYWVLDPAAELVHQFGDRDASDSWLKMVDPQDFWLE